MKKATLFLCFIIFQLTAYADGYWLELQGSGKVQDTLKIRIRYGGVDDNKHRYLKTTYDLGKSTGFWVIVLDNAGGRTDVLIRQWADCWEGVFIPSQPGTYQVLAFNDQLPVVEQPDSTQNIRPIQYLCSFYTVDNINSNLGPNQFLDIITTRKDSVVFVQPYIKQVPVKEGTKLRVIDPANQEQFPLTNKEGIATIKPIKKGLYIIRFDWIDPKPGVYSGKRYTSVRHRCDYSLFFNP